MTFHLPTRILYGPGIVAELGGVVRQTIGSKFPLLVTDKDIVRAGLAEKVLSQLPVVAIFDAVEPNPRDVTVDKGGDLVRRVKPDCVIGLGGGSAIDAAKAIAVLATNSGRIEDYEGLENYGPPPLPVVAIPTTCGTGSEVSRVAVITHSARQFKMSVKGRHMFPAAALVDPDLLMTLPAALVASTGFDALTHAIEAFTVRPSGFMTDTLALEAVRLIFRHLPQAFQDIRGNGPARAGTMRGSLLAGMAFGNSDVGAVHCLAEAVGSIYDTPHGVANAVFLPYVMEFNLDAAAAKYADIAEAVGIEEASARAASRRLIRMVKEVSRALSIPTFQELGVPESEFPLVARKAFQNNSNPSNPREAGEEDYLEILRNAFLGV